MCLISSINLYSATILVSISYIRSYLFFFFLNDRAPTEISPLPLPAALPICDPVPQERGRHAMRGLHTVDRALRPASEPLVGTLERRHPRPVVDGARAGERACGYAERLDDVRGHAASAFLCQRRYETGGESGGVRRRHARPAFDLIPRVPARDARERDPGRDDIGFGELTPARAEPRQHIARRWHARLRRPLKCSGISGADRQRQVRRPREADGRQAGSVVAGADREDRLGMADEKGVDDRIDDRASLMLVADAETHVE